MGLFSVAKPVRGTRKNLKMASADLSWLITRNNSAFLLKRSRLNMSLEPNNLKAKNSLRYSGVVRKQTVGVEPAKDGKGVVLVTRKSKGSRMPAKNVSRLELKRGPRATMATIRASLKANNYRQDLINAACRRSCAVLKSQKPVVMKRARGKKE